MNLNECFPSLESDPSKLSEYIAQEIINVFVPLRDNDYSIYKRYKRLHASLAELDFNGVVYFKKDCTGMNAITFYFTSEISFVISRGETAQLPASYSSIVLSLGIGKGGVPGSRIPQFCVQKGSSYLPKYP